MLQNDFDQANLEASDLVALEQGHTPPCLPLTALQFELWQAVISAVETFGRRTARRALKQVEGAQDEHWLKEERIAYRAVEILTAELVRRALP